MEQTTGGNPTNGNNKKNGTILSVATEKVWFGDRLSVDKGELEAALAQGQAAIDAKGELAAEIARLTRELEQLRNARPTGVTEKVVVREPTPQEVADWVQAHPTYISMVKERERLQKENLLLATLVELYKKYSTLAALEEFGLITYMVDEHGKPLKDIVPGGEFFIFHSALGGPQAVYGVLPTEVGQVARIRRQGPIIGTVEYRITMIKDAGPPYLDIRAVSLGGRHIVDSKGYRFEEFNALTRTEDGFCHVPPNPMQADWGRFVLNRMLTPEGNAPNMVEVVVICYRVNEDAKQYRCAQLTASKVEAAPPRPALSDGSVTEERPQG